jgi:hypothetical protein
MQVLDGVKTGRVDLSLLSPAGPKISGQQPACASDSKSEHDKVEDAQASTGAHVDAAPSAGGKAATIDYR